MATRKKNVSSSAAGKVSDPPDMRGEGGFESPADRLYEAMQKMHDEQYTDETNELETEFARKVEHAGLNMPLLLQEILHELMLLRHRNGK